MTRYIGNVMITGTTLTRHPRHRPPPELARTTPPPHAHQPSTPPHQNEHATHLNERFRRLDEMSLPLRDRSLLRPIDNGLIGDTIGVVEEFEDLGEGFHDAGFGVAVCLRGGRSGVGSVRKVGMLWIFCGWGK